MPHRRPTHIARAEFATPIGELHFFLLEQAIVAIEFADQGRTTAILRRQLGALEIEPASFQNDVRAAFEAYFFEGRCSQFATLQIQPIGTAFQRQVWAEVRKIPAGRTSTYGAIAKAIGKPAASRAVGAANGQNPIPILIPCHRVIGANKRLTGYGSGLDRKAWLLRHERIEFTEAEQDVQGNLPWICEPGHSSSS